MGIPEALFSIESGPEMGERGRKSRFWGLCEKAANIFQYDQYMIIDHVLFEQ